jgi:hypothetical protein
MSKKYYFTFGCGQPNENCYHVIDSSDYDSARDLMFERFDDKWAMQYDSAEAAGVEEFNLREIK